MTSAALPMPAGPAKAMKAPEIALAERDPCVFVSLHLVAEIVEERGELLVELFEKLIVVRRFNLDTSRMFDHVSQVDAAIGANIKPTVC